MGSMCLWAQMVFGISPDYGGRQYDSIAPRNIFNLKPPILVTQPTNAPAPTSGLKLMGVTTMLGYKQAILKLQPPAGKPGQVAAAGEHTLVLTEGQRDGYVEVLQIDEKAGRVKVNNAGTIMTLDFEKDGVKQAPTLPVMPNPAGAVTPAGNAVSNPAVPAVPTPTGINPPPAGGVVYPGQKRIPSRLNPNGVTPPPVTLPGTTYPPRNDAEAALSPSVPQTNVPNSQMTADEQSVINALEREMAARTNRANVQTYPANPLVATSAPPATTLAPQ